MSVITHRSSNWYQSALLRTRRETSRPRRMPTRPRATYAIMRAKPSRPCAVAPDSPRVLVDHGDLIGAPTQLAGPLGEVVLPPRRLTVGLDLRRDRLPHVHEGARRR